MITGSWPDCITRQLTQPVRREARFWYRFVLFSLECCKSEERPPIRHSARFPAPHFFRFNHFYDSVLHQLP